jgi:hypothetical protein
MASCSRGGRIERIAPVSELSGLQGQTLDLRDQLICPDSSTAHSICMACVPRDSLQRNGHGFQQFTQRILVPYVEDRIDRELAELTAAWACSVMTATASPALSISWKPPFPSPAC